ncbi:hypothetical protein GCM10017673_38490 [Streptosporangium violaceochromogenes]|nr:hypothetical protein GCM10017673_38490 [Streptosporangium violaceochromogenes]
MAHWQIQVTTVTATPLTDEQRAALVAALPGFAAITDDGATRGLTVAYSVQADKQGAAVRAASKAITDASREALGETIPFLGIRVARGDREPAAVVPELVGYQEIALVLGKMSRQRARELAETHEDFPAPVARLSTGPVFTLDSVLEFSRTWERRTGRPRKSA